VRPICLSAMRSGCSQTTSSLHPGQPGICTALTHHDALRELAYAPRKVRLVDGVQPELLSYRRSTSGGERDDEQPGRQAIQPICGCDDI
jgi:hypothetical protein